VLPALRAALAAETGEATGPAALRRLAIEVAPALADAHRAADALFRVLEGYMAGRPDNVLRLTDAFAEDPVWGQGLDAALTAFGHTSGSLREALMTLVEQIARADEEPSERLASLLAEVRGIAGRIDAARDAVTAALRPPRGQSPTVRWLERRGGTHVALATAPLELAPLLKELVFDRVETVVVTSATLAAGGSFDFLAGRLGLDLAPVRPGAREVLPSPFNYYDQCLFAIPDDVPDPSQGAELHDARTAEIAAELAAITDGGLFVLFTSHRALRRVAAVLKGRPDVAGRWPLLVQGDTPRDLLLRRFREAGSAILLGTDSFWEGVDVPGQALRALLIAKLPFRVPTEPLTAARLEAIELAGGDPFHDYLVPLAGLKLKQGFGRLIRARTDVGVVVLLDPRVLRKRYGEALLAGLPPAERVIGPWDVLRERIGEFFSVHGSGV
jgi:ATP-dependent DNA helicase DinG